MIKVHFPIEQDADGWPPTSSESLWCMPRIGTNGSTHYELRNVPFYVHGVAYEDIVSAVSLAGLLTFDEIIRHSQNSTYRIVLSEGVERTSEKFLTVWTKLEELGCTYEAANALLHAVNIPYGALYRSYKLLERGEQENVWEFEEGFCFEQSDDSTPSI